MSINLGKETVPFHVSLMNTFSSKLFHTSVGQPLLAGGIGALLGATRGKPVSYALHSTLTHIFWSYVQPCTIEPLFMHKKSNAAARTIGVILSCTASIAIPFVFNKYVLPLIKEESFKPYFQEHEQSPINRSDALWLFAIRYITQVLIGSTLND